MRARRANIFHSVFQPDATQPTSLLTGVRLHAKNANDEVDDENDDSPRGHQIRWDRAWSAVTSRIQLPTSVSVEDSFGTVPSESQQDLDDFFGDALAVVLDPASAVPQAAHTGDVLLWHSRQVRHHFVHHVLPLLAACAAQEDPSKVLLSSAQTLQAAHRQYSHGLTLLVRGIHQRHVREAAVAKFRRELHALVSSSWAAGLALALRTVLARLLSDVLMVDVSRPHRGAAEQPTKAQVSDRAHTELLSLLESLQTIGLAGDSLHVLLAEIMDRCMTDFIDHAYAGVWAAATSSSSSSSSAPGIMDRCMTDFIDHAYAGVWAAATSSSSSSSSAPRCMEHLCAWIDGHYGRVAAQVFGCLGGRVSSEDVERWREVAVGRLATLRIRELFNMDLRSAVTTPQRRLQLTDAFSAALQKRLLHPGRSTLAILQTYIAMIRTFHALDASKVLLDRVAYPLQLYLCQRDDAIRIVVTGLLANPKAADEDEGSKNRLVELAALLNDASSQQRGGRNEDDDLDWNDMSWVPDPVDAGVNYKRPRSEDVIGTLIGALGSHDIFIKEFQLIVAERLLSTQSDFHQEVKVLGLLKKRFGEVALQNCDVMIKDIYDSRRVDATLGKNLRPWPGVPAYHSKILSRLFWPSLRMEGFRVPATVAAAQSRYEAGFEQLKTARKLGWLDHLGSATVRLELEDRSVDLQCATYEAAVIYAFHDDGANVTPRRRTLNDLWQHLRMDEDLLALALSFWLSKQVLRNVGNQTYEVIERLGSDANTTTKAVAAAAGSGTTSRDEEGGGGEEEDDEKDGDEEVSLRKPSRLVDETKEKERRGVYWQFIVGMLTNSSPAMALGQISMMMKMLISDGCPWSNEELQDFLGERVVAGELELVGGKYRLPKK
ncbi:hypothetical protein L249_3442 [Ophiocordyceps polyrhachis-furcata BCC 54312]|uniref:Anaphase-promoting complex subunit 2 n=1 Tax=Ophiocordyceps polyrhachis-furcata BCC 54312 TaxID=1330021 RepID=A0A367LMP6_9HYPO|nr:hypothetical protein L249_3442 [Ophiocordyceps polyrhachis-furcata BCC 54312]